MQICPECAQQVYDFLSKSPHDANLTITNLALASVACIPAVNNLNPTLAPHVSPVAESEEDELDILDPEGLAEGVEEGEEVEEAPTKHKKGRK